jgi:hypothetical protein
MKTFALISFVLAAVFYGLLVAWLIQLARVGGLFHVPQMLTSLGWEAAVYGLGLGVLGTTFLCAGVILTRSNH